MCGVNFSFNVAHLKSMNEELAHRGTQKGKIEGNIGHVRLPIQGLSSEFDGPYEYGRWLIGYVGEIYNYKDLNPSASSDIEVVAEYFDRFTSGSFPQFDGMWSMIIQDNFTGEFHVITDPLAKKPLYYDVQTLNISSEITPLLAVNPRLKYFPDEFYYSTVAKWGYCPFDRTPFEGIRKVPPGAHWVLQRQQISKKTAYFLLEPSYLNFDGIRDSIITSVENRLVSDVPVSILCSGGLDSSIIYQIARKKNPDVHVFHIENGESEYLQYLDIPKNNLTTLNIPEEYSLEEVLWVNEGPVDLGSMIPQYHLSQAINEHGYEVVLTGDGADELFLGYTRGTSYDSRHSDVFSELIYYHLPRLDKMSMAYSIELRSPFLSFDVVSRALGVPFEQSKGKKFLKKLFSDMVPKEILDRQKQPLRYKSPRDDEWRFRLINTYRKMLHEH